METNDKINILADNDERLTIAIRILQEIIERLEERVEILEANVLSEEE